jgi:hypothetical protein
VKSLSSCHFERSREKTSAVYWLIAITFAAG